jgi:tRNA (cytidine/uridine-2'-O-)-methyltransferase
MLTRDATSQLHRLASLLSACYKLNVRLASYQPEIPGNLGALLRLSACFGVGVDIIEPCGFAFSDKRIKRAGMDYIDHVTLVRHLDWTTFRNGATGRIILLTSKAEMRLYDFAFAADDILVLGQESAGVPDEVRDACDTQLRIPLDPHVRSLNVSVAAGIALAEALRQTGQLPI